MSVTLPIIIGTIVGSWLIALCFKDFRERCKDDLPDLLLDFYKMYKEDDSNGVFYKIFLAIVVFAIYPLIIAIIIEDTIKLIATKAIRTALITFTTDVTDSIISPTMSV